MQKFSLSPESLEISTFPTEPSDPAEIPGAHLLLAGRDACTGCMSGCGVID